MSGGWSRRERFKSSAGRGGRLAERFGIGGERKARGGSAEAARRRPLPTPAPSGDRRAVAQRGSRRTVDEEATQSASAAARQGAAAGTRLPPAPPNALPGSLEELEEDLPELWSMVKIVAISVAVIVLIGFAAGYGFGRMFV